MGQCKELKSKDTIGEDDNAQGEFVPDTKEDLGVHVDEADEGEDPGGEGGVPDEGQGVPEDEGGVPAGLAGVHLVGAVVLGEGHLHELGHVQGEGQHGDRHHVHQQPLGVAHRLEYKIADIATG